MQYTHRVSLTIRTAALVVLLCAVGFAMSAAAAGAAAVSLVPGYSAASLAPGAHTTVNILIRITTPELPRKETRPPVAVSLVLDRSGSMQEEKKIAYARQAARMLVNSLEKDDLFALVIYDDQIDVLAPLAPVRDKHALLKVIDGIAPRGWTNLSGGLEKGIAELKTVKLEGPARVVLLSDGLANRGLTGAEQVAGIGAKAKNSGIMVSAIGLGLDFNEDLMQHLAQRGGGQYYYINDSEMLPSVFKQELNLTAATYTKDVRLAFAPAPGVEAAEVYGYSTKKSGDMTDIEMGNLTAGEERTVMLRLGVTPGDSGTQDLGAVTINYVSRDDGAHRVTVPLRLEVIADAAARTRREKEQAALTEPVRNEALLLDAEAAHIAAVEEVKKGNIAKAKAIVAGQKTALAEAAPASPVIANKLAQLELDEGRFESARSDTALQQDMAKKSKASAYMSAKGQKQALMLRPGDNGYMVEKLQQQLKEKGHYTGPIDGTFNEAVAAAVRAFQKAQGLPDDGIAGVQTLHALGM